MARGGSRQGAGRKPLHLVVRSKEAAQKAFDRNDKMPLEIMLDMINGRTPYDKDMIALCQAAAPYLHPRLSAIEAKVDVGLTEMEDDDIDSRIEQLAAQAGVALSVAGEGEEEG